MLVHGLLGFDKPLGSYDYWLTIPQELRAGGARVYAMNVSSSNEALRVLVLKRARSDPTLSGAERLAIEQELEAGSPGCAAAIRESALREQLTQLDAELERQGASAGQRHAERSALLGSEAADRFAQLDRVRSDWNARVQVYSRQLAALRARTGLSEPQRRLESQRLLAAFSPAEQRRLAALQKAGALR